MFGRILTGVVFALCVVGVVGFITVGDWRGLALTAWPLLFAAVLVSAMFWRPRIEIADPGVTVVNVLRTWEVPWSAIERIDTRYALTLFTKTNRIAVWAAPSPGVRGTTAIGKRDISNLAESSYGPGGTVRPGDAVNTPSGQVAFVMRSRWEAVRDAGEADEAGTDESRVTVKTHRATIAALIVLGVASVVSALL